MMAGVRDHSGILPYAHLNPKGIAVFHRPLSDPHMPMREARWGRTSTQPEIDYICPHSVHRGLLIS